MTDQSAMTPGEVIAHLLNARSVAVIGASANVNKPAGRTLRYLHRYGFVGRVYPVHPEHSTVQGLRAYRRVGDLPEVPEVAVIAVPGPHVIRAVEECGAHGIACAVIFSAGFAEVGGDGVGIQDELAEAARRNGIRLLGPNCVGVVTAASGLTATFMTGLDQDRFELRDDGIAFVSQSGAMGGFLLNTGQTQGLGIGRFFSTGNEADLDLGALVDGLVEEGSTRTILAYVEGVRDGRSFAEALAKARARDVAVAVMKVGRSTRGAQAAESHTGALAGSDRVFDGLLARHGVPRADDIGALLDFGRVLNSERRPRGGRISVVTLSGGAGALVTDYAEDLGLDVFAWEGEYRQRMAELLPAFAAVGNPIDTTGAIASDPGLLTDALTLSVEHPHTDIAVVLLGNLEAEEDQICERIEAVAEKSDKPILVAWVGGSGRPQHRLNDRSIPTFDDPFRAMRAAAALVTWSQAPEAGPAVQAAPATSLDGRIDGNAGILDERTSKAILADQGIGVTRETVVGSSEDAVAAAAAIGFPVVMKLHSDEIEHKSDVGAVKLNLATDEEISEAAGELLALAARLGLRDRQILVAEQIASGPELILGSSLDPVFGPVTLVGAGGVLTEIMDDVQVRPSPVTPAEARTMLTGLRTSAILRGVRGYPAADLDALSDTVSRFSRFTAEHAGTIEAVDVNPLMIRADGSAVAADGVIRLRTKTDG